MSRTNSELRFSLAGLSVRIHATGGLDNLAGFYHHYAHHTAPAPDVVIELEHISGYAAGKAPWPDHPAFRRIPLGPHRLGLDRFDASGTIEIDPGTRCLRARFRGDAFTNTLEAAIRIAVSMALPLRQGLLLHASAIEHQGGALLFAGPSGAGKSTIARLLEARGSTLRRLADELVAVTRSRAPRDLREVDPRRDRWRAWVTPFIGGDGLPHGASAPVRGLYFLRQARAHRVTPLDHREAIPRLLQTTLAYSADSALTEQILDTALQLLGDVPAHELEFTKDPDVAQVLDIT